MIKNGFIPKRSPFSLIQEDLFPNEWLILCVSICLNQTSRKQVEKIFHHFVNEFDTPQNFFETDEIYVKSIIRSLGFMNRRYERLLKLAQYIISHNDWDKNIEQLPGIGEYGRDSYNIFCQGLIKDIPPKDGSLVTYWKWYKNVLL